MKKSLFVSFFILIAGVAFGQTLKKGGIVAFRPFTLTLQPDVTMNQYLDFLAEKYIPELEEAMQGWTIYMLKGDRGQYENEYTWMYWIESVEARDLYVPRESDEMTEEGRKAFEKIMPLYEELQELGTGTSDFTDWVIL